MKISKIFCSIQGESKYTGLLTTFIRFFGCGNNCSWCDTKYSFEGQFFEISYEKILNIVKNFGTKYVCITGGEPLEQENELIDLIKILNNEKFKISLETNGFYSIKNIPKYVHIVMDYKLPSACSKFDKNYFYELKRSDELKLVIASYYDFYYSLELINGFKMIIPYENIVLSPIPSMKSWLAKKIIEFELPVKLGLQIHKILDIE